MNIRSLGKKLTYCLILKKIHLFVSSGWRVYSKMAAFGLAEWAPALRAVPIVLGLEPRPRPRVVWCIRIGEQNNARSLLLCDAARRPNGCAPLTTRRRNNSARSLWHTMRSLSCNRCAFCHAFCTRTRPSNSSSFVRRTARAPFCPQQMTMHIYQTPNNF